MKRTVLAALAAAIIATPTIIQTSQAGPSSELSAKQHSHKKAIDANGNSAGTCSVVSHKTGATARVGCAHVATFQGYVDDLEGGGAAIYFMGGIRRGKCWSGGLHPCGKALDVCQLSRGRVDAKCHLPRRAQLAAVAERHGLVEGGRWNHSDYGHAQVGGYSGTAVADMRNAVSYSAHSKVKRRAAAVAEAVVEDWRGH